MQSHDSEPVTEDLPFSLAGYLRALLLTKTILILLLERREDTVEYLAHMTNTVLPYIQVKPEKAS